MKIALRFILAAKILFIFSAANAQVLVTDPLNQFQTTISAVQAVTQTATQYQQYSAQLNQLADQIKNSTTPNGYIWNSVSANMSTALTNLSSLNQYSSQYGGLSPYLSQYPSLSSYQTSACFTGGACTSSQYSQLANSNIVGLNSQKTATDNMIQNLNTEQQLLNADANNISALQQNSQSAGGRMESLQYANQFAGATNAQLLQIRSLMVAQQTADAARQETQTAELAREEAAHQAAIASSNTPSDPININPFSSR